MSSNRLGSRRTDAAIDALAAHQHGVVTRVQLLRCGLGRRVIDPRVRAGILHRIHAGVYRAGPIVSPLCREMAAVLACSGAGVPGAAEPLRKWTLAVVGLRTAAALHALLPPQRAGEPVDVIVPRAFHRGRRRGVRAHRVDVSGDEVQTMQGIPVTTAARTLVDIAACTTRRELERALAIADREHIAGRDAILAILQRQPRSRGTARLRTLLDGAHAIPFTRSAAEESFLELLRAGGLPMPRSNVVVDGFEVDFYWKDARLVIEIDGFTHHVTRRSFIRDRQRNSALAAAGIQVLRLSWDQVATDRERTLVQVAQVLAQAR
jgi:very-short-patch-repair endonuclease